MAEIYDSELVQVSTPQIEGVVIMDPTAPGATIRQFMYGNVGRTENLGVANVSRRYLTQVYPEYSFSGSGSKAIGLNLVVPYGEDYDDDLDALKDFLRSRKPIIYKDNRGRMLAGVITSMSFKDMAVGSEVSFELLATHYPEITF